MSSIYGKESIVWSKGDACLSPYSGDDELYRGVIQKIRRSPAGNALALIKFDGYTEDDMEEVTVDQLEKVKVTEITKTVKGSTKKKKSEHSPVSGGMFSPLQGSEYSQRLKAKYDSDDDDDDEFSVKNEKLSAVLFGKKQCGSSSQVSTSRNHSTPSTPRNQSRKGVVAVGGQPVSVSNRQTKGSRVTQDKNRNNGLESPRSGQRKGPLEITGGQAKDYQKELITSKRLSDISSIVEPGTVRKALEKHAGTHASSTHSSSSDGEDSSNSGFNEEDLEKPKFTFKADGAKVPLVLSGDKETPVVQVPGPLNQYLRDYQREGIKFLYQHYKKKQGAILGDDMGLGKTVQVIGFLSALLGKQGNRVDVMRQKPRFIRNLSDSASVRSDMPSNGPFLIIGPGCVLYNWIEEFETWGYFSVRKYHGSDKAECMKELRKGKIEIVITTFETFREHMDDLNTVEWDSVLVDEVHKIKDMKARTTKALREINTSRRYGLTGTALQNNLLEFWSILDWARPGCLGFQQEFLHEFVRPIEVGQRHDANKRELATARKQKEKLADIRKTMMIRRMKSLIADQLPKKDDSVVFCKLSQLQVSIYQTILDQPGMDLVIHGDDPCGCDSGEPQSKCCKRKAPDGQSVRSLRFTFMHLLLKTANHVALLIPTAKTSKKQADTAHTICQVALSQHPEFMAQTKEASFKTLSDPKYCGKMKVLQGLLKVFYREHSKVLVFSYSTHVLDIIEQYLMSTGYEYRRIDGTVSSKKRMVIVREYNTDPNIFICLISTKAGGLGLNLTGANKVVIFDPNWNPTHDLQAQDRAYRIGQRRNVMVYRLVSTGTIEENMYLRQIYKQQLLNVTVEDENAKRYFYAVQGNPRQKGELFGVKNMFILRTGESCITRDIIKRNERVESALEGFETAQYISPVVRVEEDEDYEDLVDEENSMETTESEDLFAQLFFSDESDDEITVGENKGISDVSLGLEGDNPSCHGKASRRGNNLNRTDLVKHGVIDTDSDRSEVKKSSRENEKLNKPSDKDKKTRPSVRFQEPPKGKVKPSESKTGKGPVKGSNKRTARTHDDDDKDDSVIQYDQTLAGTFADVSDVFDNCGVVHIHKNVKVVGGSRAEDHMSRCALSDVYELNQNSQELAAQCEPMSESSEEEPTVPVKRGRGKVSPLEDHNTARSTVIGYTNVLIGQTPKTFKMRYFKELSKQQNSASPLEFAELVLSSSVEDRIKILNSFYESRDPALADIHQHKPSNTPIRKQESGAANTYSKKKYAKVSKKSEQKSVPARSKGRAAQSIAFLDNIEPDSESISQHGERSDRIVSDEESSIEVGRKITPKKRGQRSPNRKLMKKFKVRHKSVHEPVPPTYLNDCDESLVENERHEMRMETEESVDSEDLLDEISRIGEENEEMNAVGNDSDTLQKQRRTVRQHMPVSSILDDVFGGGDISPRRTKKPPPLQSGKNNSPKKRVGYVKENRADKILENDDDPFKLVDEIFGDRHSRKSDKERNNNCLNEKVDKTRGNESKKAHETKRNERIDENSDDEVHLEASTLKDDQFDCFDDPKLWRKRKRKKPDKRNIVDVLIEDSDADFNDLFTSGKLKRKASKSESLLDGSASLFS